MAMPRRGPDFIDLDALAGEIAHMLVVIVGASFASLDHQFNDRVLAGARQSSYSAD